MTNVTPTTGESFTAYCPGLGGSGKREFGDSPAHLPSAKHLARRRFNAEGW